MIEKLLLISIGATFITAEICTQRCYPGGECFPKNQDIDAFRRTLNGDIVFPYNSSYHYLTLMYNVHYTKFPAMIVYVASVADIQKSVIFAKKYNLHVTIQSSGHDYIGRSTWHGSFMINMAEMKTISVNMSSIRSEAGEINVQTGAGWLQIYETVSRYNRVVVGGSAHTVTPGGYTQGGGHSPISRYFGLAVDQVLEIQVVTADGSIINCTADGYTKLSPEGSFEESSDSELFWAIRGGGGGTFGVVVSFTYKLHRQPTQIVQTKLSYLLSYNSDYSVGKQVFEFYFDFLRNLPNEWGGYLILANTQYSFEGNNTAVGTFDLVMNHFGEWNLPSRRAFDKWINFLPEWRISINMENKTGFFEYERSINGSPWSNIYMLSSFVQKKDLNENLTELLLKTMTTPPSESIPTYGCTATHIGGKISTFAAESAPIHPGFRSGVLCSTCYVVFEDPTKDDFITQKGKEFYSRIREFGNGVYINEPVYDLPDWKDQYWGNYYPRLLESKRKWDPDNMFTCHHCVGSDIPMKKGSDTKSIKRPRNGNAKVEINIVAFALVMISGIWITFYRDFSRKI